MTRIRHASAALAALTLLTACSGGSSGGGATDIAPTEADAKAAAAAINLVAADLPGFTGTPDNGSNSTDATDKALATCLGLDSVGVKSNDAADVSSDDFTKGQAPLGLDVQSEVEVLKSADRANTELKALQSGKAAGCISASFVSAIKDEAGSSSGITFGTPTATAVRPATADEKAFGFDITIPLTAAGQNVSFYVAIRGFLVKHSEVTLTTGSFGTPFDMATTDALLSKLTVRAATNAV